MILVVLASVWLVAIPLFVIGVAALLARQRERRTVDRFLERVLPTAQPRPKEDP